MIFLILRQSDIVDIVTKRFDKVIYIYSQTSNTQHSSLRISYLAMYIVYSRKMRKTTFWIQKWRDSFEKIKDTLTFWIVRS